MRPRWWYVGIAIPVLAVAGYVIWNGMHRVHEVSVQSEVSKFRSAAPSATASAVTNLPRPESGVYVYATTGSERISLGNLSHKYPAKTTVTVTDGGCGLDVRWTALSERWSRYQVCPTQQGWRVRSVTDVHKFLYRLDQQDYVCDDPVVLPNSAKETWSASCSAKNSDITLTVTKAGTQTRTVGGKPVDTTRLHVVTKATGASKNDGTVDVWLLSTTGLPVRVQVVNHGEQNVLGQLVTYDEAATFELTSLTPAR